MADELTALIDGYHAPTALQSSLEFDLTAHVHRHRLLPVLLDAGGCFGILETGKVVSFMWDEPDVIDVVEEARLRDMTLFDASQNFPSLSHLKPVRPEGARDCGSCGGTGVPKGIPEELKNIACYCGGLGWLRGGNDA